MQYSMIHFNNVIMLVKNININKYNNEMYLNCVACSNNDLLFQTISHA